MNEPVSAPALAGTPSRRSELIVPLAAALLGATLIYLAGFAPIEAIHDGAHDARHSAAFPCH